MELRSRKIARESSNTAGDKQDQRDNSDDEQHAVDIFDDDVYEPSSDSDHSISSEEGPAEASVEGHVWEFPNNVIKLDESSRKKKALEWRKRKRKNRPPLLWEIWEEKNEMWIDEHLKDDINLDHLNELSTEIADAPPELVTPLLRYQKEWLAWALKQEDSAIRGGILADEMGMGKTIQAIALVLAKRKVFCATGEPGSSSVSPALPGVRATLVICPLVAVRQWQIEIDTFTSQGSTRVLIYHGPNRERNAERFAEFDFVITTYSTVEAEYRKYVMPPKQQCEYCGKSFIESKLKVHLNYYCGPGAYRTAKQAKQEKKKVEMILPKAKKHSSPGSAKSSSVNSVLHSVRWQRIILDEAHFVKDRRSNTARAVLALESLYKWALSGTPLQNRVGELYSLIRFLQITPYSFYFCKDCNCRTLDHSAGVCSGCPHSSVRHFCWWNRYISRPCLTSQYSEDVRAMILLKHKVLKNIVLRRTKMGRAADLALPPRIVSLRRDSLDIREEDYYKSLYNESRSQFNTYVQAGTLMNNYAHIFDLLTRLRQAVDHPYLVVYSQSAAAKVANITESAMQICGFCQDTADDPVVTKCAHCFCKACLYEPSGADYKTTCPTCSAPLTVDFMTNAGAEERPKTTIKGFKSSSILNRIRLDDFQTSTKIEALREEIRFMVERDGSAKGIVFSQFTSFLDLINYSLHKSGINCVQLVGSMSINARDAAIKRFNEDPDCRIFLMSLKAGGVALNLTVASHVFLMDPWWNPAVEQQAQDRIHRIGQYKPIRTVRFVIENTVEERILKLQEKKELVFEGTIGGSSEALGKLTAEDMGFLFQ